MPRHFGDRLHDAIRRTGTFACVGLDPRPGDFPPEFRPEIGASRRMVADCIRRWAMSMLDPLAALVPVIKLQSACFEAWGPQGIEVFADIATAARIRGLLVIGDVKRGDIGSSADLYARAYLEEDAPFACDAITVSPYLGGDSLEPFYKAAEAAGRGVFVLCKTSNQASADFQDTRSSDGRTLYERIALAVAARGHERRGAHGHASLGLVVGATYPEEGARIRAAAPHAWFLVPGYGHQGGSASMLSSLLDSTGGGILVSSSRGITEAWQRQPGGGASVDFIGSVHKAVIAMKEDLASLGRECSKS